MTAAPTRVGVGDAVALNAVASDADGDAVTVTWTSGCAGTFTATTGPTSAFTPTAVPAGNLCTITASVSDGRGGTATGSVGLWVGLAAVDVTDLASQLAVLAERAIYFGHQSVGGNVMDGVRALLAANPGAEPP